MVITRTYQSSLVTFRALSIILYGKYCDYKNLPISTGEFEGIVYYSVW